MDKIINDLKSFKDDNYARFNSKLIPNINSNTIIGVRIPQLRKYCNEIIKNDLSVSFMNNLPHKYHEENILHALIINSCNDLDTTIMYLNKFLPYVDNWAVCDSIKPLIFKKDLKKVYENIKLWLKSSDIYSVRFAIVTLLTFYLDEKFDIKYNSDVANVQTNEYYIKMAMAWYFSYALIKQYETTIKLFESKTLDKWIHNKSIQKARESYRISSKKKEYLNTLKIV
ncbi:MAG: DNA alkylation repair protein [Tenericutes bacterium]|nr:DNA alkylation repair protein [Mycoplasmatota bacterium]